MNYLKTIAALLVIAFVIAGCEKEAGPAGPMGNANIRMYSWGPDTAQGSISYHLGTTVTKQMIDSSMILVYYNPSDQPESYWYAVPGMGPYGNYHTRYFVGATGNHYFFFVELLEADGSGEYPSQVIWKKFRVLMAPANVFVSNKKEIDFNNYYEVCHYLHLQP